MGKYEGIAATAEGAAEPLVIRAEGDAVTIPDAHLLFSGDFSRNGADLVIAGEGLSVVVADYFGDAGSPVLTAPNGAVLLPGVVGALAGPLAPGQYAQAEDAEPAQGIGSVVSLTGSATAQRGDGSVVDLTVDSRLAEGDVVQTASGSALGIVFDDGAVFTLNADSRMVLNELVYEPGGGSNSMLFSMVQGVFAFVAGQVAPTGEMRIDTPAASMGIRGTSGIVKLETIDGVAVFRVIPDPVTNDVGTIVLYSPGTDIILVVMESSDSQWAIDPATGQVIEQPVDPGDAEIIEQLHRTYIEFAGIVDDPGETRFAETNGSGLPTQFSLTSAEIAAIVALAGGAFPQIEPLAGEPVVSGVDFGDEPEGSAFDPAPPPPPPPEPGNTDPQQVPQGGFTGDDVGRVEEDGGPTTGQLVFAGGTGLIEPLVVEGTYGTFQIDADGNWVYTPDNESAAVQSLGEGDSAQETFAVVASDGSETQFVTITVQGVNDVPTVTGTTTGAVVEDGTQVATGTVTVNDPDAGESSVQPLSDVGGSYGTFSILADGNWTYVLDNADPAVQGLAEGETVTDSFTVTSSDGTATETVTVTVTGTNDAPVARNDAVATNEDAAVSGNVLDDNGNGPDDDVDGDPLSVTHVNGSTENVGFQIVLASGALLLVNADGSYAYDPNGQFEALGPGDSAQDSFTYTVADGQGGSDTATVTLTINGVNDAPVATASLISTNEDVAASGLLTGSDVNPGDTLTFSLEQGPQNGTLVMQSNGIYTYTPDPGFLGQDSFTFHVTDGQGAFDTAVVAIEVGEVAVGKNVTGTAGNDVLIGSAVNDFLSGGPGNDFLDGSTGQDFLQGGAGDDHLVSGGATAGFDPVSNGYSFFEQDRLEGGPGNDTLVATSGDVLMFGGPGNDIISSQDDGSTWVDFTRAAYRNSPAGIVVAMDGSRLTVQDGFGGTDTVSRVHVLVDSLHDDVITVDSNYQTSFGTFFEARLSTGDDTVTFVGFAGRISYQSADGPVMVDLQLGTATDLNPNDNFIGTDTFIGIVGVLRGSGFDDQLFGTSGNDRLRGEGGDDLIDGRGGTDTIQFAGSNSGVHVDLSQGMVFNDGLGGGVDTLVSIENVDGSPFRDLIIGDAGANRLHGGTGDDTIRGGAGNDTIIGDSGNEPEAPGLSSNDALYGGVGDDSLSGGAGDDLLTGGLGSDVLIGGDGADRVEYRSPDEGGDTIFDFAVSEDVLVVDATFFGGGLAAGQPLPDSQFVAGASPQATDPEMGQFLYDTSNGDLFWDSDGTGELAPVHIANLTGAPPLSASDFEVVGSEPVILGMTEVAAAVDAGSEPVA